MPRECYAEKNVLEVQDKISGDILTLYYNMPTNTDRVSYGNALFVRKGKKVVMVKDPFSIQAKYGLRILSGIKKGDFTNHGKVYASEPSDPDYDPDWKKHVEAGASDVMAYLARHAFGSVEAPSEDDGIEIEDLEEDAGNEGETKGDDFVFEGDGKAPATEAQPDPLS